MVEEETPAKRDDVLTRGVPLEDVQDLAGHSEPRTTASGGRWQKPVTQTKESSHAFIIS